MTFRPGKLSCLLAIICVLQANGPGPKAAVERAGALSGSGYTVLGRTFLGEGGNLSYLRFLNLSGTSATIKATLIGSPSGHNYGTADVIVANNASRQLSISDIMRGAGMSALASPDDRLAVYLQSASEPVAVQHVLYSDATGFFENLSNCQNSSIADTNAALINVHTSRLSSFPSTVVIHNFGDSEATYDIDVYKAETGESVGRLPVTIGANATFEKPFSYFEQQLPFTPDTSTVHVNLVAFPRSGAGAASLQHLVYNARVTGYENLTNFCTISASLSGLPIANDDNIAVPSNTRTFTIAFATLTANDGNAATASLLDFTQPRANGAASGSLTRSGNDLTLTPGNDGLATFEYRLRNSAGDSHSATVTLNVGGVRNSGDPLTTYTLSVSKVFQTATTGTGDGNGTVTSSPASISCGDDCTKDFTSGTTVTLTASPATGSRFVGWSGACSGTGTCTITMSANKSVTATFAVATYTLTVVKAGTGLGTATSSPAGINCGSVCSYAFESGTTVTITPGPSAGVTSFRGWSGCTSLSSSGAGTNNLCNVRMDADHTVTGTY